MGKLVTTTGDLLDAAIQQAEKMTLRGQEIQQFGRDLAVENMEKLEEYRTDLHENYFKGIRQWRETCTLDGSEDSGFQPKEPSHIAVEDVD
jgi:hypothetical protein